MEANWRTENGRIIPLQMMTNRHIDAALEHCSYKVAGIDLSAQWPGFAPDIPKLDQKNLDHVKLERMFWVQWLRLFTWELSRRLHQ